MSKAGTHKNKRRSAPASHAGKARAQQFAKRFYQKHGTLMSKLSRA
ncbi:MAG: hypothetical protein H6594_07180 [Flavobacteriales bacterium]|nr:hypothetical protein [Flavobacteriales bacterium]